MAYTYSKISTYTVGSEVPSVTFLNIPQNYTDLVVKYSVRGTGGSGTVNVFLKLNGSSTTFSGIGMNGTGSAAQSFGATADYMGVMNGPSTTANTFSSGEIYIPNYTGSNNKSLYSDIVTENNATTAYAQMNATLWSTTSSITNLSLTAGSGNYVQHSTFHLYGIKAEL